MRYLSGIFFLLLISGLLLPGCSETPEETNLISEQTVLSKETGPGAWILIHERNWVRLYNLTDFGVVMAVGINDMSEFCARTGGRDWKVYREITLPDRLRVIEQVKGKNITIMIWKPDSWPAGEICDMGEPFATGIGNIRDLNTDYLSAPDEKAIKVISYRMNGTLTGADNIMYHLNFFVKSSWDGIDPSTIKSNIKLDLTPIGKK